MVSFSACNSSFNEVAHCVESKRETNLPCGFIGINVFRELFLVFILDRISVLWLQIYLHIQGPAMKKCRHYLSLERMFKVFYVLW
jgi:hypothetical protein